MKNVSLIREHIKEVIDEADEETLEMVLEILEANNNEDPLENMSPEDKQSLQLSLEQAAEGNVIPHAEVKKEYEKWLTK